LAGGAGIDRAMPQAVGRQPDLVRPASGANFLLRKESAGRGLGRFL